MATVEKIKCDQCERETPKTNPPAGWRRFHIWTERILKEKDPTEKKEITGDFCSAGCIQKSMEKNLGIAFVAERHKRRN